MPPESSTLTILAHLRERLAAGDVRGALRYLNAQTPHRFTGLYEFRDPRLDNLHIVDKQNPDTTSLPDVPVTATYCAFARSTRRPVAIEDARLDERFEDHPARNEIISYTGVPLIDRMGEVFGTICHYDYAAVEISAENVALLEAMSALLLNERRPTTG